MAACEYLWRSASPLAWAPALKFDTAPPNEAIDHNVLVYFVIGAFLPIGFRILDIKFIGNICFKLGRLAWCSAISWSKATGSAGSLSFSESPHIVAGIHGRSWQTDN
ncbi:hypothetical protein C8J56DRAFT_893776 [Mycena floridula]|nr:hypothetical protein C8J56DRAFT_893776 [Mycena floridula]